MKLFLLFLVITLPTGETVPVYQISRQPLSQEDCETALHHPAVKETYFDKQFWPDHEGHPTLVCSPYGTAGADQGQQFIITGYVAEYGARGALGTKVLPGRTAAVSPKCRSLLGNYIYVDGHGVFYCEDLTHPRLDEERGLCSVDLLKPTYAQAMGVGNEIRNVVVLGRDKQ